MVTAGLWTCTACELSRLCDNSGVMCSDDALEEILLVVQLQHQRVLWETILHVALCYDSKRQRCGQRTLS
jgi:hypothetical protein